MNFNKPVSIILLVLLLLGTLIAVNQYHLTTLISASSGLLTSAHFHLCGSDPLSLFIQFYILFFAELHYLYAIYQKRASEVFINSHSRLWLAVFFMAAISLAYYRVVISLQPQNEWYLLLYYPLALVGLGIAAMLQQWFLLADLDHFHFLLKVNSEPILQDFGQNVPGAEDFQLGVIRRAAPFVLLFYLLIPGLILNAPFQDWLTYIALALWAIWIIRYFLSLTFLYIFV
jgi:hypothetical protein